MKNMHFLNEQIALWYLRKYGEVLYCNMYKLQDGRLIKKCNEDKIKSRFINFSEDRLLDFKDLDIEGVSFVKALAYIGLSDIFATITWYVPGKSIDQKFLGSYQIDNLIEAIRKFEITIKNLSDIGISATMDVYTGNIVYDGETLTLIDTTEYCYREKKVAAIYEDNMSQIMNEIFFNIFTITGYNEIHYLKKYFEMRNSRYAEFNKKDFLLNPTESLIEMRKLIEEDFGVRLNTFNESHLLLSKAVEKEKSKRRILETVHR